MFSVIANLLSSPWILFLSVVVLLLTYDFYRRLGLPPGPYGLPFVGYIFFFNRDKMAEQCNDLCQKYKTDILTVACPGAPMIILNSYDLVKECYQKRTDLADRDEFSIFCVFDDEYSGVIATSGEIWRDVRRFSISMLRDFGMGRIGSEERIQNESLILADAIMSHKGLPFDPQDHVNVAVSNIICGIVLGQRFDYDDEKFTRALGAISELFIKLRSMALFFSMKIKCLRGRVYKDAFQQCLDEYRKFNGFVKDSIAEHRESYNGEVTDFIHGFLKEMENGREYFTEKMLESLITDFFIAGSETSSTTLRWALLTMASYPKIQDKVYEELNDVIGNRTVSMGDKKNTPYTEAVINETQRFFTLAQLGAIHSNLHDDVLINGYKIPPKSIVFSNVHQIHHDQDYWKNAHNFDPENFLENGKLQHMERFIPFGIGRRACAGEALARMEIYIFFASLIKKFEVKLETDGTVPVLEGDVNGLVYQPRMFKLRMVARQ